MPNESQSEIGARESPEAALTRLGLELPAPAKPVAAYIPTRVAQASRLCGEPPQGGLIFVSGQIPLKEGKLIATGTVPSAVSVDTAAACARQCVLNALAAIKAELGSLDLVRQVVRVGVWVASDPGFTDQPRVANGASDLLEQVFGEAGRHARAAVGSVALPLGAPVEVEMVVEI
jgi:enamine deaminase RidA (YjgF/YER057c/UK114 family)